MKCVRCVLASVFCWISLSGNSAIEAGVITIFTDRSLWDAAVVDFVTEDFESAPLGTLPPNTLVSLGSVDFSYTGSAHPDGEPLIIDPGNVNGSRELNGIVYETSDGGGMSLPGPNVITFPYAITAWGADFTNASTQTNLLIEFAGETIEFVDYHSFPGSGFLGMTSDMPFSTITLDASTGPGAGEAYQLDDLSYSALPQTPEPSSFALLSIGSVALIGYVVRRKRKRTA